MWLLKKERKAEMARAIKQEKSTEGCTFKPRINRASSTNRSHANLSMQRPSVKNQRSYSDIHAPALHRQRHFESCAELGQTAPEIILSSQVESISET